jgi:hypothetical protein
MVDPTVNTFSSNFWDEDDHQYGMFHSPHAPSTDKHEDTLVVFVHGILGSPVGTWGDTPRLLLQAGGCDLAVLNFQYPAGIAGGDIEAAAKHLTSALSRRPEYRHVIYICHSTGGLVVKAMLRSERESIERDLKQRLPEYRSFVYETLRTRRIVNLDVPHSGGSLWHSLFLLVPYICFLGPFIWLLKKLIPPVPFAYNKIPIQLFYKNKWVLRLEHDYISYLTFLDTKGLPRPTSLEVLAADDQTIALYGQLESEQYGQRMEKIRADTERLLMRGTHLSMHHPAKHTDLICHVLGRRLRQWTASTSRSLAELTLSRIYNFTVSAGVSSLVGEELVKPTSDISSIPGRRGHQQFIRLQLEKALRESGEKPRVSVLTGQAGVGKSVVLRIVARDIFLRNLANDEIDRRLALLVPLQRVSLSKDQAEKFRITASTGGAWELLGRDWCAYVNDVQTLDSNRSDAAEGPTAPLLNWEWLCERLRTKPTVLMLDAIDEFLAKNLSIGFSDFVAMLQHLLSSNSQNGQLHIVLGVRSELPGVETLASTPNDVFRVRLLSMDEAESLYPGVKKKLKELADPDLEKLFLTPLILGAIGPILSELEPGALNSRASLLTEALAALIRKTDLHRRRDLLGLELGVEPWLDALMVVAWQTFLESRTEIALTDIQQDAQRLRDRWNTASISQNLHSPLRGLELATDLQMLRVIFSQTVFFPTTSPSIHRFLHQQWEEFLASRYLAQCIRHCMPDELGARACTHRMLRFAGEQLGDLPPIGEKRVQLFFDRAKELERGYIVGNFATVLGNSRIPMEGPAMRLLLKRHSELIGVSRYVLLTGLGYRALRDKEAALCKLLGSEFSRLAAATEDGSVMPAIASMAWCHLRLINPHVNAGEWPDLRTSTRENEFSALAMVSTITEGVPHVEQGDRSIQRAFVFIQGLMTTDPYRPISLVHYLYFLCLASKYDAQISEVDTILHTVLSEGSPYEQGIKNSKINELMYIYQLCRQLVKYNNK